MVDISEQMAAVAELHEGRELLDRLIGGDKDAKSQVVIVPTTVIEGQSVAPPRRGEGRNPKS